MAALRVEFRNISGSRAALTLLALEPDVMPPQPGLCGGHSHLHSWAAVERWAVVLAVETAAIEPGERHIVEAEVGDPFMAELTRIKWSAAPLEGGRFELLGLSFGGVEILGVGGYLATDPAAVGARR